MGRCRQVLRAEVATRAGDEDAATSTAISMAPVWAAGFPGIVKPIRRAARLDGFFPANLEHPDQLAEMVATITDLRSGEAGPYDIAISLPFDADPLPYAAAGATWWLPEFDRGVPLDTVRGVLRDGPARPGGD